MGRSPKPLTILIYGSVYDWEEIRALEAQGHTVKWDNSEYDVILGSSCWLMDEQHRKYLPLAISEARRRRYPPTKKESA
jgi:hypothetical protein